MCTRYSICKLKNMLDILSKCGILLKQKHLLLYNINTITKRYNIRNLINNNNSKFNTMTSNSITSKRFVLRKSLIGSNTIITFTNKKGDTIKYSHDKAFSIMKDTLTKLPCWLKYKSYTATNNIPVALRGKELV